MGTLFRSSVFRWGLFYSLASIALFLFSFTQVDLSLTLSRSSLAQRVQQAFQYVGYYQRPVATTWYAGILVVFFSLYAGVLVGIARKRITPRAVWGIIACVMLLLVFSYPAFSYDVFNYMFTAKTVLVYQKNPYTVIPLQFSGVEPWLSFMHWTHLPSAYTPLWIALTLPAYVLGFGYFLLILWNMKILVAGFYLLTVWFLWKILMAEDPKHALFGAAIFALNPLVIIETLVSGHNDIVMMAIAMMSLYFFARSRRIHALFLLALSVAMKLMTICILPVYFLRYKRVYLLVAMLMGFGLVLTQREVLGWYWVWIMPFVALLPRMRAVTVIAGGVSLGLLLRYAPFIYYGHWDPPVAAIKSWVTFIPILLSLVLLVIMHLSGTKKEADLIPQ